MDDAHHRNPHANTWRITTAWGLLGGVVGVTIVLIEAVA